jgi:[NiFe] hydrogenase assembly HybE family chaperone
VTKAVTAWSDFERFYREVDARMQDLPIYHPDISIEIMTDERSADVAVLITPWCMNAIWRDVSTEFGAESIGEPINLHLPAGEFEFTLAYQPSLGAYASLSLLSPLTEIVSMEDAQATAREVLEALLHSASPPPDTAESKSVSRRGFLRRLTGLSEEHQ